MRCVETAPIQNRVHNVERNKERAPLTPSSDGPQQGFLLRSKVSKQELYFYVGIRIDLMNKKPTELAPVLPR